jgi:coenzyme Q-binding protein COQ10
LRHAVVRILPYTPAQLLDLVGDVEAYPKFVPWITSMRVWNQRTDAHGETLLDAEAGVGFSFLRERVQIPPAADPASRQLPPRLRPADRLFRGTGEGALQWR